jgi:hypothetical protein
LTIPNSVTNIGPAAFQGCTGISNITIPESVTIIQDQAFDYTSLTSVTIPGCVTNVGSEAFTGPLLTNVIMLSGVSTIWEDAFQECPSLASVTIPGSVTNIEEVAFAYSGLTNVIIPNGVLSIGYYAFSDCLSLESVTISGSVTNLGLGLFYQCPILTNVLFTGNAPTVGSDEFYQDTNETVYYTPGTQGWTAFSTNVGVPTVLWNPLIQTAAGNFGISNNQFGFNITGTAKIPIVVEACTNLANPVWSALTNVTLTNGSFYFSEPLQTNLSARFYGLGFP